MNGTIPSGIGNSTLLQILRFQDNLFSGDIPTQLQNLQFLEVLNIGKNNFDGPIPTFIGLNMPRLELINLYESGFTGAILDSLCDIEADNNSNTTIATLDDNDDVGSNTDPQQEGRSKVLIVSCNTTTTLCNCCAALDLNNPLGRFGYYEAPIKVECAEDLLNL